MFSILAMPNAILISGGAILAQARPAPTSRQLKIIWPAKLPTDL
ncbi:hypothetical protein X762_21695 [Mesorhizobium sp. LSHC426A00]|nr:hypothetical protein X762_21695 [Mesorhizobium sp. LSHC426A00]